MPITLQNVFVLMDMEVNIAKLQPHVELKHAAKIENASWIPVFLHVFVQQDGRATIANNVLPVQKAVLRDTVNGMMMLWSVLLLATKTVEYMELVLVVVQIRASRIRIICADRVSIGLFYGFYFKLYMQIWEEICRLKLEFFWIC